MKILKGRYAGHSATLHQFANNWMTVDLDNGTSIVVHPHQVQLDPAERERFTVSDPKRYGSFFQTWKLEDDGTFRCLLTRPARVRPRRGPRPQP